MIPIVTIQQMRQIESAADADGISYDTMMENAGRGAAHRAIDIIQGLDNPRVVVLIGAGNNGGDGLVAARYIVQADEQIQVGLYLLSRRDDHNFKRAEELGLFVAYAEDDDGRVIRNMVASADLVIDALFGIGVRLPIRNKAAKLLRSVNQVLSARKHDFPTDLTLFPTMPQKSRKIASPRVLAIDCPSGLNCDTGEQDANTIPADETITFIAAKPGLITYPGAESVGRLSIAPLGIPSNTADMNQVQSKLVTAEGAHHLLPQRPVNSNKGTFGKTLIIAGSTNYVGAAGLAARSAYRAGAGLVTVGAPGNVISILASQMPEPTWLILPSDLGVISANAAPLIIENLPRYTSLLIGPGWGTEDTTATLLEKLLESRANGKHVTAKRGIGFTAQQDSSATSINVVEFPSLVVDADALNLLSKIDTWWKLLPDNTIITPHPGEMARLAKLSIDDIQNNRIEIAQQKAQEWNVILLLKGAHTIVASPQGETFVLPFKTDALATAGTGDVLAGIISGLLSQGMPPQSSAAAGAYIHGLAGELAGLENGSTRSVIASDVLAMIPGALNYVERA